VPHHCPARCSAHLHVHRVRLESAKQGLATEIGPLFPSQSHSSFGFWDRSQGKSNGSGNRPMAHLPLMPGESLLLLTAGCPLFAVGRGMAEERACSAWNVSFPFCAVCSTAGCRTCEKRGSATSSHSVGCGSADPEDRLDLNAGTPSSNMKVHDKCVPRR
jgi:hypothetical protein